MHFGEDMKSAMLSRYGSTGIVLPSEVMPFVVAGIALVAVIAIQKMKKKKKR